MWSSCRTLNVVGHVTPVAGLCPPPPPAGGPASAIEKPWPGPEENVPVDAFSVHGAGSVPLKSSRNCRRRSDAFAQLSPAGLSTVIRYAPAGTA